MNIKIVLICILFFFIAFFVYPDRTFSQEVSVGTVEKDLTNIEASESGEASGSAKEATSASIVKRVVERSPDITEDKPEVKGKFEKLLEDNPVGSLNPLNALGHGIRYAVSQGVPANTLILVLLFPVIATIVVIARHVIGLKSFGIFTPALLSVVFLNTGLLTGILLFAFIILVSSLARFLLKKVKVQYMPRMAIFMWIVSMGIFFILMASPLLRREELMTVGIFPILILILLNEDYLDLQITRSFNQAIQVVFETLIVAVVCYFLMSWEMLQKAVLLSPEIFIICLLGLIALIERYDGLRLLEIWRFRKIIKKS